jgi:uncharacterized protein HemX
MSNNNGIKIGGSAVGAFVAGDNNRVETTVKHVFSLPDPATVRISDELAGLRAILVKLNTPDASKLGRALDDAEEEAKKPKPDRHKVGSALEEALKVATKAADFAESGAKLAPYVAGAVAWLGANWVHLLPMVGL